MELTFDGESCTYAGPSKLKTGPVTLLFHNESEASGAVNLVRHTGDETIQDMIDHIGDEPTNDHPPGWAEQLGTYRIVQRGETDIWEGVLEAGIHTMVCARYRPYGVWHGAGFTVED